MGMVERARLRNGIGRVLNPGYNAGLTSAFPQRATKSFS